MCEELKSVALNCVKAEKRALDILETVVDDGFVSVVDAVSQCMGTVVTIGVGKSGIAAAKMAASLSCIGVASVCRDVVDLYHGGIGGLSDSDVIMAFSRSGNTEEIIRLLPEIRLVYPNITIIGICCEKDSSLAAYSDIYLPLNIPFEADPLDIIPTASFTACSVIGDAIVCATMHKRHVTLNDIARFHPGGSLGKKLRHNE